MWKMQYKVLYRTFGKSSFITVGDANHKFLPPGRKLLLLQEFIMSMCINIGWEIYIIIGFDECKEI